MLTDDWTFYRRFLGSGPVAHDLEAAGIPKDRIVLAFKSPKIRLHTGYAVA